MAKTQNNYTLTLSGEKNSVRAMAGAIVCLSASLTRTFVTSDKGVTFFFRYKGDARLVLKRIAKTFDGKLLSDTFEVDGARASVKKLS